MAWGSRHGSNATVMRPERHERGNPGRESNPVLSCSQDEAVIQTQGASRNLRLRCDRAW